MTVIQLVIPLVIFIILSLKLSAPRIVIRREATAESQENAGTVHISVSGIKSRNVVNLFVLVGPDSHVYACITVYIST